MKSSLYVEELFYRLLSQGGVTDVIEGNLFKGSLPPGRDCQDIVLGCLTHRLVRKVHSGLLNINLYCPDIALGVPDYQRIELVLDKVVSLLKEGSREGLYYTIENISSSLKDQERPALSYVNIRLSYQIR